MVRSKKDFTVAIKLNKKKKQRKRTLFVTCIMIIINRGILLGIYTTTKNFKECRDVQVERNRIFKVDK